MKIWLIYLDIFIASIVLHQLLMISLKKLGTADLFNFPLAELIAVDLSHGNIH